MKELEKSFTKGEFSKAVGMFKKLKKNRFIPENIEPLVHPDKKKI